MTGCVVVMLSRTVLAVLRYEWQRPVSLTAALHTMIGRQSATPHWFDTGFTARRGRTRQACTHQDDALCRRHRRLRRHIRGQGSCQRVLPTVHDPAARHQLRDPLGRRAAGHSRRAADRIASGQALLAVLVHHRQHLGCRAPRPPARMIMWASTDRPPDDWPAIVALCGSPPNGPTLSCTQRRAACWSISP